MTPLPIIAGQVALSTQGAVSTDTFCNGILTSIGNFARASTTAPNKFTNGMGMATDGILSYVDATAGLPAGYTFSSGLPRDLNGALCVSTAVASTYSNGVPFAANSAVSALISSMNIQFAGASTLDPRITFTRASSGTHFDSTGLLVTASTDVARFDYDPVTLAPLGLLIEEARTNLALDSGEVLSGGTGGVAVADQITAPDGSLADFFREDTGNSEHYASDRAVAITAGTTYTWSFYAKLGLTGEVRRACVRTGGQGPANVIFDLETGNSTVIAPVVSSGISSAGNGWFRCWIVFTATGTGPAVFRQQLSNGANTVYTGNGTSGLFFWGAQVEVGAFPTSYIPTVASQVTRAADTALMTGTNFSSWYNQSEGTFVVTARDVSNPLGVMAATDDGTSANLNSIFLAGATTAVGFRTTVASVVVSDITVGAIVSGAAFTVAAAYKINDFAATLNGAAVVVDSLGGVPLGQTTLRIGAGVASTAFIGGHLQRLTYYNTRLTNAQLQSLSA